MLDEVDKELERRGHKFARYADDSNIYVRSQRAGERVLQSLRRLYATLHLKVNESKNRFHAYTKQRKTIYDRSHRKRTLKKLEAAGFKSG